MTCLTPKPAKKEKIRNNWIFFWLSLSPELNPLDYAIWSILENKTNATSHPNIGSLKTATEEEGMSEEFIYFEGIIIISKVCWYNS